MSDYIKRDDIYFHKDNILNGEAIMKDIKRIKSADVAPVRHGRWEVVDAEEPRRYGCSECKRLSWHMDNYCPNCGARMDGENDE